MKKILNSKMVIVVALFSILALGSTAFADWGSGSGRMGKGMGYRGEQAGDCPGYGYGKGNRRGWGAGNLTEEQIKQLDEERKAFFETTNDARRGIYQKRLELKSELAKKITDVKKASAIQKELSDLQAGLAQKRLELRIRMKEINPDFIGMGPGSRDKGKRGRGGFSGGHCWE